jgi:hypothetical protein
MWVICSWKIDICKSDYQSIESVILFFKSKVAKSEVKRVGKKIINNKNLCKNVISYLKT